MLRTRFDKPGQARSSHKWDALRAWCLKDGSAVGAYQRARFGGKARQGRWIRGGDEDRGLLHLLPSWDGISVVRTRRSNPFWEPLVYRVQETFLTTDDFTAIDAGYSSRRAILLIEQGACLYGVLL